MRVPLLRFPPIPALSTALSLGAVAVSGLAFAPLGCSADDEGSADTQGGSGDADTSGASNPSVSATTGDGADPDETGSPPAGAIYFEDFEGADGSAWPSPWTSGGDAILSSEIVGGRARMNAETTAVGRMLLGGFDEVDADVTVVVEFDDWRQQGFGFYARQNGGVLHQTATPGQGYAVYVEGGFQGAIGVWRELDGVEEILQGTTDPIGGGLESGTPYRIRFQCEQAGDATMLRLKIWPDGSDEPGAWQLEHSDATPQLQDVSGSFAADVYNYAGTGSVYLDEVEIRRL